MGTPVDSTYSPLAGLWQPTKLERMYYGANSVEKYLTACLPKASSKAVIITGSSLANKTDLVKKVETLLGAEHHAATYSHISQHAPIGDVDKAAAGVQADASIDTVVSIGGGSPIDAAKVISSRVHDKTGKFLHHIAIPTTLSVAECSFIAGFTRENGVKDLVVAPQLAPQVILYDATFARETPPWLLLSTAMRALDHAVELLYNPTAAEAPAKALCLAAIIGLFRELPHCKRNPGDEECLTRLQLACFNSLYPMGYNIKGGIGLSHTLGYLIGSPYCVPHGITSCITLPSVVRFKAETDAHAATQLARVLPYLGKTASGDSKKDALALADAIEALIKEVGMATTLTEQKVGRDQASVIAGKAAGGQTEGKQYEAMLKLVEGLY